MVSLLSITSFTPKYKMAIVIPFCSIWDMADEILLIFESLNDELIYFAR